MNYIHRSQRVTHAHTRRWELELVRAPTWCGLATRPGRVAPAIQVNGPFEEDGLYTWVYEVCWDDAGAPAFSPLTTSPRVRSAAGFENQALFALRGHAVGIARRLVAQVQACVRVQGFVASQGPQR